MLEGIGKCVRCGDNFPTSETVLYYHQRYCKQCCNLLKEEKKSEKAQQKATKQSAKQPINDKNKVVAVQPETLEESTNGFQQLNYQVCRAFGMQQIPEEWLSTINSWNHSGKSYANLAQTVQYCYFIIGVEPDPDYCLKYIKTYYDSAMKYFAEQAIVVEHNLAMCNTPDPVRTIHLSPVSNKIIELYELT